MITMSPREALSVLAFLLLLVLVYGLEVWLFAFSLRHGFSGRSGRGRLFSRGYLVLHVAAVAGIACMLYGYFIEPYWIDVHTVTIRTHKLQTARFRVVQVSDLHCDRKARNEEEMVRIINNLRPDLVVATGDYLNDASALPRFRDALKRLTAPLGKFAVLGNLDLRRWRQLDLFDGTGFRRLDRETVIVTKGADRLSVSGLDFARSDAPIDPIESLPADRFNILLFHTPDLIEDVGGRGVDLYLCGHTHGGQVCLPGYGALITFSKFGKKYESGLHRVGETTLYVNRGLGLEPLPGPQVRFLARPEIAVFDIVPEQR